jgi:hypothetical protein
VPTVVAVDLGGSRRGPQKAHDEPQGRGFAGTVWAK